MIKIKLASETTLSEEELSVRKVLAEWHENIGLTMLLEVTYRKGMKDSQSDGPIAKLQRKLIKLGHLSRIPESEFGIYGSKTAIAVKNFQKKAFPGNPKEHDGVFGEKTYAALSKTSGGYSAPAPSAERSSRSRSPRTPSKSATRRQRLARSKKAKYFKGKKRPQMSFAKKGSAGSKMTPLKLIASGKLGTNSQLKAGGSGRDVEALKMWLADAGLYNGIELDAYYDPNSSDMTFSTYDEHAVKAIKRYQERLSIEVTGKINQETAMALVLGVKRAKPPERSKTPLRFSEEPKQTTQGIRAVYTKIFGTPNPSKFAVASILKSKTDMVDRNYQLMLKKATTRNDPLYQYMIKKFVEAVGGQGGKEDGARNFYGYFSGLARKTIRKEGWTSWDAKFKEFALNPIMIRSMFGKDVDAQKVRALVSNIFDADTLNAQMFAAKMKSGRTVFTKKEEKVIRYLGGENSYLVFNLKKTELSWALACGRKSGGSGKCKALKERNINNLSEMIHPKDLVLKKWRATSGHLTVYKNIKGKIDNDTEKLIRQEQTFKLKHQANWPAINKILQAFREIGKAQNEDIRQAADMGPLPLGVYRVSDYQEKSHKTFEGHFSRNMSTKVNQQWSMIKNRKEKNLMIKLLKRFNFVPSKSRDTRSTVGADGKRYRGNKQTSWNVSSLTSAAYAWGYQRMWLTKLNVPDSKARKRSGFSIHGGAAFGSSGCIDLGATMGDFSAFYKKAVKNSDILLISTAGNLPARVSRKYYLGKESGHNVEGASV